MTDLLANIAAITPGLVKLAYIWGPTLAVVIALGWVREVRHGTPN